MITTNVEPAVTERITDFASSMRTVKARDVTARTPNYTIEEALEYLNDGLNLLYCRPGDQFGVTLVFSDTFSVDVDGSEEISPEDLEGLAEQMIDAASNHYYGRTTSTKAPFMFEIRQAGEVASGSVPISSWFIMEEEDPADVEDEYPYEGTWPYGHGDFIGCGSEPNGYDAPDLFRRDLRKELVYGLLVGKGGYYYNRLYTICFSVLGACEGYEIPFVAANENYLDLDNPNDPTENDNYFDRLLWRSYEEYSNYHDCLIVDEMNFHFEEMVNLAQEQLESEGVEDRVIVQVEVGYNTITGPYWLDGHCMQIYYANIVSAEEEPVPLPAL